MSIKLNSRQLGSSLSHPQMPSLYRMRLQSTAHFFQCRGDVETANRGRLSGIDAFQYAIISGTADQAMDWTDIYDIDGLRVLMAALLSHHMR